MPPAKEWKSWRFLLSWKPMISIICFGLRLQIILFDKVLKWQCTLFSDLPCGREIILLGWKCILCIELHELEHRTFAYDGQLTVNRGKKGELFIWYTMSPYTILYHVLSKDLYYPTYSCRTQILYIDTLSIIPSVSDNTGLMSQMRREVLFNPCTLFDFGSTL